MVGVLAAQSLGEPLTQLTLNSVEYNTCLVITKDNHYLNDGPDPDRINPNNKIGLYIDYLIENDKNNIQYPGDSETIYLPIKGHKALTVDDYGTVLWKDIIAVTRHLPINKDGSSTLVKVKTKSGREIIETKAKSF